MRRHSPTVAVMLRTCALLGAAVLLVGCTDRPDLADRAPDLGDPERCAEAVTALVAELQEHVDAYAAVSAEAFLAGDPDRLPAPADEVIVEGLEVVAGLGCDPETVDRHLRTGIGGLTADGPIREAVVAELRVQLLDGAPPQPWERELTPADDLARVLAAAPDGSALTLTAGTHRPSEPLRATRELTLSGSGADETRVVVEGGDSALVVDAPAPVEVADLTIKHEASATAAVVQVATPTVELHDVRVTGGAADDQGAGGAGILIGVAFPGPVPGDPDDLDAATPTLRDVEVVDNHGAGILVTDNAAPRIVGAAVRDNGSCGICYLEAAAGTVTGATIAGNTTGLAISQDARPTATEIHLADNVQDGVIVDGDSAPRLDDLEVVDNGRHGVLVTDAATVELAGASFGGNGGFGLAVGEEATADLADLEVDGHEVGLWVEEEARATLSGGGLAATGGDDVVGIVVEDADLVADGTAISGYELGLELREDARAELTGVVISETGEAAVVARDRSMLTGADTSCEDNPFDVVLFDEAANELDGDGCTATQG